jgi:serine/threonine protein kinase
MHSGVPDTRERRLGRYVLHGKIAAGGMATVHFGRLVGEAGFSRVVAIKRMGSHLAQDADFRAMFLDEARLASRIRHPNVISTIDVGSSDDGLFLVMEYVAGESLSSLLRAASARGSRIPLPVALRVIVDSLYGLHAAHTATDDAGHPLSIVHRDVSPQNILVGADGHARVLDFGIAKAAGSNHTTREGQLKGKFRYMAPEQVSDKPVTPRTDVYAASVVLWEALTGEQLFGASNDAAIVARVLEGVIAPPSKLAPTLPAELDQLVLKGLARDPDQRFGTALEMAESVEGVVPIVALASARQVGAWVEDIAGDVLKRRKEQIARMDAGEDDATVPAPHPVVMLVTQTNTLDAAVDPVRQGTGERTRERPEEPATLLVTPTPEARRKAGAPWIFLGGASFLALTGFGLVRMIATTETPSSVTPAVASSAPSEPPAAATPAPASSPSAAPSTSPSSTPPHASATPPSVRPPGTKASAPTKPSCSPPYYQDSTGIRRVKPECL